MILAALTALLPLLTGLGTFVTWLAGYFSDGSTLRRLELSLARQTARAQVERERLLATYARISREPDRPAEAVVEDLTAQFRGPGDAPKA